MNAQAIAITIAITWSLPVALPMNTAKAPSTLQVSMRRARWE